MWKSGRISAAEMEILLFHFDSNPLISTAPTAEDIQRIPPTKTIYTLY